MSTSHFVSLYDFRKVVEWNCENQCIIRLYRNTFDKLKSATAVTKGIQNRYSRTSAPTTL